MPHPMPATATPERLYRDNLDLVEEVVESLRRRKHLSADETEDLRSRVHEKLLDDDYAILRKFEGRSNLGTYLTVVVHRVLLDWRTAEWGKWRPSAAAKRRGEAAILLERLTTRDGFTFDEACRILQDNHGVELGWQELEELAAELPARNPRPRGSGDDELFETLAAAAPSPHDELVEKEREQGRKRVATVLVRALDRLPPEDRLILEMRYRDDFKIVDIARALHLEQKPLYRRIERLVRGLRGSLEKAGIHGEDPTEALRRCRSGDET